jgi:hypothetical protein
MNNLIEQYEHNTARGANYEPASSLPDVSPTTHPVRFIAFYLPQFHAIPQNDAWWGTGFTEWTNVTKALPRFRGHYQPRLPADFGFYDLTSAAHIRRQVDLSNRAGLYGWCIHNYWHSGTKLLEKPLRTIRENPDIPIKYCLNWANETWSRRWDGSESEILIGQNYAPGEDLEYAEYISEFFEDDRYITIDGRPLMMLYRPGHLPDARGTVERWREFFHKRGHKNPYIVMPQAYGDNDPRIFGMDAAVGFPPHRVALSCRSIRPYLKLFDQRNMSKVISYDEFVETAISLTADGYLLMPGVCPQWDNEARRPNRGLCLAGSTPAKYGGWLCAAAQRALSAPGADERIIFINAWNEWAEGAYLEPDRHFGFAYLAETARTLAALAHPGETQRGNRAVPKLGELGEPHPSIGNYLMNFPTRATRGLNALFRASQRKLPAP